MDSSNGGRREPNKSSPTSCCFETLSQDVANPFHRFTCHCHQPTNQGIKHQHEAFYRRILSVVPRSISCGCICTTHSDNCDNKVRCLWVVVGGSCRVDTVFVSHFILLNPLLFVVSDCALNFFVDMPYCRPPPPCRSPPRPFLHKRRRTVPTGHPRLGTKRWFLKPPITKMKMS